MKIMNQSSAPIGFTLVEVLVVLGIIGIACLVVIPLIGNTDDMQAMSAAREMVSTLLYTQTLSVSQQQPFQVVIDSVNHRYEVQDETGQVIDHPLAIGLPYRIDFSDSDRMQEVRIEVADFDGNNIVWFDRMGAPYGGAISASPPPLNQGRIDLRAGDARMRVEVEPVSGRVRVTEL